MIIFYEKYSVSPPTFEDLTEDEIRAIQKVSKSEFKRRVKQSAKSQYKEWLSLNSNGRNRVYILLLITLISGAISFSIRNMREIEWVCIALFALGAFCGIAFLIGMVAHSKSIQSYQTALTTWKNSMFKIKKRVDKIQG